MKSNYAIILSLVCSAIASSSFASFPVKDGVMGKNSLDLNVSHGDPQASKDYLALEKKVPNLLAKHNFAELEKIADNLRALKYCYPDGHSALSQFYALIELPYGYRASNERWDSQLQTLQQWQKEFPQSKTAPVALANGWINYAWRARGHGDFDDLKPQQKQDMNSRLSKARAVLEAAESAKDICPFVYVQEQLLGSSESWSQQKYNILFKKAVTKFPNCFEYYFQKAVYLQPNFSDSDIGWPDFADIAADKIGGTNGDKLYARIVWFIDSQHNDDNIFSEFPNLKWSRIEKGIQALQKEYPNSNNVLNEYLKLALEAHKKPIAEKLVQKVGKNVDLNVWQTKLNFLRAIDNFENQ